MDSVQGTRALPRVGFPIRKSPDRCLFSGSPRLIAAVHVLHRLLVPRHPPCALVLLSSRRTSSREHQLPLCSFQGTRRTRCPPSRKTTSSPPAGDEPAARAQSSRRRRSLKTQQHGRRPKATRTTRRYAGPWVPSVDIDSRRAPASTQVAALERARGRGRLGDCLRWCKRHRIPRKEVIQPQLPLRLPCYDFTPVTDSTFDCSLPCGLGHRLRASPASVV
jgi:hypothetical protein